jgi:6-phospho-beta-glucosidase
MAMETGGAGRPADDANLLGGEGSYQRLAIATLAALRLPPDRPARLILDVPAGGALPGYDPADVVEIACAVSSAGVAPIRRGPVPPATAGLMAAVAAYERLTVAAAVRGDRDLAVLALMAHPLVRSYALAERLVDAYLDAHRAYLPQFA